MPNAPGTPYNEAVFLTSHNAFSNSADGWIWYQQQDNISQQLTNGVRAFMIDLWRANINGSDTIYLLHEGWTNSWFNANFQFVTLESFLLRMRTYLANNPSEVVTLFFDTGSNVKNPAGRKLVTDIISKFNDIIFRPITSADFNTPLGQFTHRLVIFSDYRGKGDEESANANDLFGLPSVWHYCIESVYGDFSLLPLYWANQRDASLASTVANRTMGIVNHFPTWDVGTQLRYDVPYLSPQQFELQYFSSLNSKNCLLTHIIDFRTQHKIVPNFVAVDMMNIGDGVAKIEPFCRDMRASSGSRISLKGINNHFITTETPTSRKWLLCQPGDAAQFEIIGPLDSCALRYIDDNSPDALFLSYRDSTGAVKLYDSVDNAIFNFIEVGNNVYKIECVSNGQYMYIDDMDGELYITGKGISTNDGRNYFIVCNFGIEPWKPPLSIRASSATKHDGQFMICPEGIGLNNDIALNAMGALSFQVIGPLSRCVIRVLNTKNGELLFLSYRQITGCLKCYDEPCIWSISKTYIDNFPAFMIRLVASGKLATPEVSSDYIYLRNSSMLQKAFFQIVDADTHETIIA